MKAFIELQKKKPQIEFRKNELENRLKVSMKNVEVLNFIHAVMRSALFFNTILIIKK